MTNLPHYTEGIMEDGAALLRDGVPVPIEEVVKLLNERETYFNTAVELHKLLDDIDSCSDVFKPELTPYHDKVVELSHKRHDYFTTDGYSLFDIETQQELLKIATQGSGRPKYYRELNTVIILETEGNDVLKVHTNQLRSATVVKSVDHDTDNTAWDYATLNQIKSDKFREVS